MPALYDAGVGLPAALYDAGLFGLYDAGTGALYDAGLPPVGELYDAGDGPLYDAGLDGVDGFPGVALPETVTLFLP